MRWRLPGKQETYDPGYNYGSYSDPRIGQSRSIPACCFAIIAAASGYLAGEIGLYSAGFAVFLALGQIFQDLRVRKAHREMIRNTRYTTEAQRMAQIAAKDAADLAGKIDERFGQVTGEK